MHRQKATDCDQCSSIFARMEIVDDLQWQILWMDETYSHLKGIVTSHTRRNSSSKISHEAHANQKNALM